MEIFSFLESPNGEVNKAIKNPDYDANIIREQGIKYPSFEANSVSCL